VWLLPEPNNNLKWCPVFIDHYNGSIADGKIKACQSFFVDYVNLTAFLNSEGSIGDSTLIACCRYIAQTGGKKVGLIRNHLNRNEQSVLRSSLGGTTSKKPCKLIICFDQFID